MFKSNGGSVARNDKGVKVSIYSQNYVEYKKNDYVCYVPSEIIIGADSEPVGRTLFLTKLTWEGSHKIESITKTQLNEIRNDLEMASRAFNYPFDFA